MHKVLGKFERSQRPVGHGGFHDAILDYEGARYRYFYDCGGGKAGAQLIEKELAATRYDFGVVSHFDIDHFAKLEHADVGRLYIPYMDTLDILLLTVLYWEENGTIPEIANQLRRMQPKVVMVRHGPPSPNNLLPPTDPDTPQKEHKQPQDTGKIDIEGWVLVAGKEGNSMSDAQTGYLSLGTQKIVAIKFYNHHASDLRALFRGKLDARIAVGSPAAAVPQATAGSQSDAPLGKGRKKKPPLPTVLTAPSKQPYADTDAFLADATANPGPVIDKNAHLLKEIYIELLKSRGEQHVKPSNLSSLTMCTWSVVSHYHYLSAKPHRELHRPWERDGWMLTGDLELIGNIWKGFYEHYFREVEHCAVFNVPHHGSKYAFEDRSLHRLNNGMHFLLPVRDGDKHHPAPALKALFERHGIGASRRITVSQLPESEFSLSRIYR